VHRCEVPGPGGALEWLTLPLARQPRETMIKDLAFAADARAILDRRLTRLPWLVEARGPWADRVRAHLYGPLDEALSFLEVGIALVGEVLDLRPRLLRSSTIGVDRNLRGADRVIAIVQALNGRTYVNASGGRALYQGADFRRAGLELKFLVPYSGRLGSILPALVGGDTAPLRIETRRAARLVDA
jgi:hypothetical protein